MVGTYFTSQHEDYYEKCKPCPESDAYWPSRMTFWWSHGLIALGFRKPLEASDLYQLPEYIHVANLEEMPIDWSEKWPLVKALYRRYLRKFTYLPLLNIAVSIANCITPLLVMALMSSIQSGSTKLPDNPIFSNAWQVVAALGISGIVKATLKQQYYWCAMKAGLDFRSVFMSLVYKKALKASLSNKKKGSAGQITNLMANDADAILEFMWATVIYSFTVPLQLIALLLIAVYVMGPSGLVGFIPMVSVLPIQTYIAKKVTTMRDQSRAKNDERVNLLSEILQGIRLLKLYNWESPFKAIVHRIRESQLALLFKTFQIELWSFFATAGLSGFALAAVFATYVYSGHTLTIEDAFTTLTLYQTMAEPLRHIQWVMSDWPRLIVSLRYMETFLRSDEVKGLATSDTNEVKLEGATFLWDPLEEKEHTEEDI